MLLKIFICNIFIVGSFYSCIPIQISHFIKIVPFRMGLTQIETINLMKDYTCGYYKINDKSYTEINNPELSSLSSKKYSVIVGYKGNVYHYWAFENDKLIYWGLPLEFARHESQIINEIGIEAAKLIKTEMN